MFVTVTHLYPSLIFVTTFEQAPDLVENIILGQKQLAVTNALAYYSRKNRIVNVGNPYWMGSFSMVDTPH